MAQVNLDLLNTGRDLSDQMIEVLQILRYQTRYNSDENVALETHIANLQNLSLVLDGLFYRMDGALESPERNIAPALDKVIPLPNILTEPVKKAV